MVFFKVLQHLSSNICANYTTFYWQSMKFFFRQPCHGESLSWIPKPFLNLLLLEKWLKTTVLSRKTVQLIKKPTPVWRNIFMLEHIVWVQNISIPPPRMVIRGGGWGSQQPNFEEKYKAKLKILGGKGCANQITILGWTFEYFLEPHIPYMVNFHSPASFTQT